MMSSVGVPHRVWYAGATVIPERHPSKTCLTYLPFCFLPFRQVFQWKVPSTTRPPCSTLGWWASCQTRPGRWSVIWIRRTISPFYGCGPKSTKSWSLPIRTFCWSSSKTRRTEVLVRARGGDAATARQLARLAYIFPSFVLFYRACWQQRFKWLVWVYVRPGPGTI